MVGPDVKTQVLFSFLAAFTSAYFAHKRGRNPYLWFFLGGVFGIFGLMAIFFAPRNRPKPLPPIKLEPQPYLVGPVDKFWYHLDPSHQQQGPMSYQAITKAWKEGKIKPSTYIWHEELVDWKPLEEIVKIQAPSP